IAPKGTPEAFGSFWAQVTDIGSMAAGQVGPEHPYVPTRLAVLVTDPAPGGDLPPGLARWPLSTPIREFGALVGATDRCGVVEGPELPALLAAVEQANVLSQWTDGTTGGRILVVRPVLPGEAAP